MIGGGGANLDWDVIGGVGYWSGHRIRAEDPTVAELLKPLVYATGQFGKTISVTRANSCRSTMGSSCKLRRGVLRSPDLDAIPQPHAKPSHMEAVYPLREYQRVVRAVYFQRLRLAAINREMKDPKRFMGEAHDERARRLIREEMERVHAEGNELAYDGGPSAALDHRDRACRSSIFQLGGHKN
jgi:hypothetical protein